MNAPPSPLGPTAPPLPRQYGHPHFAQSPPPPQRRPPLTPARAATYARHLLALLLYAAFATALTYRAGAGLNVPLVCGGLVALSFYRARGRGGWRAALAPVAARAQLLAWAAIAVATVVHFDDWTTVSLFLATVVLSATLLTSAPDPFRGLVRGLTQVTVTIAGYVGAWRTALRWGRFRVGRGGGGSLGRLGVPVAITLVFAGLYVASNEVLSSGWRALLDWVANALWSDLGAVLAVATGWSFVGAGFLFAPTRLRRLLRGSFGESVISREQSPTATAGQRIEWSRVSLTLAMVNAVALVLNVTDVFTTWLSEPSASGTVLKRGVHDGTWTLVVAIVAAAVVMGYGFRQNPPDIPRARRLAVAWLIQNAAMALTVALRNYHYVDAYGLTYKRIGVYLFLVCAVAGLYLLGRKVWESHGFERLVRRQAWVVYGVLATAALCNWPGLMTRYNLGSERLEVDRGYLSLLLPYNAVAWAGADPTWIDVRGGLATWYKQSWRVGPADWRDWDLAEAQRAALVERHTAERNPGGQ